MKMGVFQSFSALTGCTAPSAAAGCSPKHGFAGIAIVIRYKRYANLKYKYGNRHFWCRGYYVSTVGANRKAIQEYIRNQLQKDYTDDQMSIKEHVDPFKGQPITEGK
ncbi:MAG: transposase [Oscillospiraceae bacterium]